MIYYLKYDIQAICKRLIAEELNTSGLDFHLLNTNELDIRDVVSDESLEILNLSLAKRGIEVVASHKSILVQKIKEVIVELVNMEDKVIPSKTSYHLATTLNQNYRHLSSVFSELTHTTIENYFILQKIEKAKDMIADGTFTFTEIAWKLNYSSIGHFSMQFKNTTGFAPSYFKRLLTERRSQNILLKTN